MKSPSTLALASLDDVSLLVVFVEGAVEEGTPSFLAANCAKNDAAEGEDSLLPLAPPPNLERFVSGEFLKMLGVDEREEEEEDEDEAALLPVMPPLLARSRSTSDELVAAAEGATVDADRPSPG